MNRLLLSGFDPFGNFTTNPSFEVAKRVQDNFSFQNTTCSATELPTNYADSFPILQEKMSDFQPTMVFMLGLADQSNQIRIETTARNLISASIPDNHGILVSNKAINPAQDKSLQIVNTNILKIPVPLQDKINHSTDAGTFVCNHLYFQFLTHSSIPGWFIHIPNKKTLSILDSSKLIFDLIKYNLGDA